MSLRIITFFLCINSITGLSQETNNPLLSLDTLSSPAAHIKSEVSYNKLFETHTFTGDLKNFFESYLQVSSDHIFSNKMDVVEDSIRINFEIPNELQYSKPVIDFLLESLQRAYRFEIRDTLLPIEETAYLVTVADEHKLRRNTIRDYSYFGIAPDLEKKFNCHVVWGRNLKMITSSLASVKTKEKMIDGIDIPIVSFFPEKYDGLYNYIIPDMKVGGHFETLMDINPIIFNYGLQVQKVTRPVMGKVIEFFEVPDLKFPVEFEIRY